MRRSSTAAGPPWVWLSVCSRISLGICLGVSLGLGCNEEPSYVGKACSADKPCPGALRCASNNTCQEASDLGPRDAGPEDAGDAGPADLGAPDIGDTGLADLGPPDLGPPDLGPEDLGPPDLGPPDLGPPDLGLPQTITVSVAGSADDALQDPGGPMLITHRWVSLYGDNHWGALRFSMPSLPTNAIILDAFLRVYVDSLTEDWPNMFIFAEASANPAPLTATDNNISDRPRSSASVAWMGMDIGDGWKQSPSVAPLIEETVQRAGWSGTFVFIFDGQTLIDDNTFEIRQWDFMNGAFSAELVVTYR